MSFRQFEGRITRERLDIGPQTKLVAYYRRVAAVELDSHCTVEGQFVDVLDTSTS